MCDASKRPGLCAAMVYDRIRYWSMQVMATCSVGVMKKNNEDDQERAKERESVSKQNEMTRRARNMSCKGVSMVGPPC